MRPSPAFRKLVLISAVVLVVLDYEQLSVLVSRHTRCLGWSGLMVFSRRWTEDRLYLEIVPY